MSKSVLFSVIVPLYNKAPYIARCLNSIFAQTFSNFEIIVVDDCSTDNGVKIAKRVLETSNLPSKIIRRSKRGGSCAPPRSTGCRHAKGKFVAFLDADDVWLPGFLMQIKTLTETFPDCEAFAASRELNIDDKTFPDPYLKLQNNEQAHTIELEEFTRSKLRGVNPFRVQGMAFRPEALDDIGGFIHAPRSSDVDLMYRFLLAGKKAAWTPVTGLKIYRVPGSTVDIVRHLPTRCWYYSVSRHIQQSKMSNQQKFLLRMDIANARIKDILGAWKRGILDLSYISHLYPSRKPISFSVCLLGMILPSFVQRRTSSLASFVVKRVNYLENKIYKL